MRKILFCIVGLLLSSASMTQQLRHTIERGETFELIARRYNISVNELMAVNPGLDGCFVGMEINIPEGKTMNNNIDIVTSSEKSLIDAADDYERAGRHKKAISTYSKVLQTTQTAEAYYGRGISFYNRQKYKSAIKDFETAIASADCTEDVKEHCEELIEKARELREEQHERRNSLLGGIIVGAAAVAATAYVASEQSKAQNSYNQPSGNYSGGDGSDHLNNADRIIAQSTAHNNSWMAQNTAQLNQMSQMTLIQAQQAKGRSDRALQEQIEWMGEFNKENGRSPTEYEIDQWYAAHYPDLLESRILGRGNYNTNDSEIETESDKYKGEHSPEQYRANYRKWESYAENRIKNLTSGGYIDKDKNGNIKGKSNYNYVNGIGYMGNQMGLHEIQREMRKIRLEAGKYGVYIEQSKWETATASY